MVRLVCFILLSTFITYKCSFAEIRPSDHGRKFQHKELKRLKSKIKNSEKKIHLLVSDIEKLENNLGKGNRHYLKVLRKKRGVEIKLFSLKKELKNMSLEIDEKKKKVRRILKGLVVNSFEKSSLKDLAAGKVLSDVLSIQLKSLNESRKKIELSKRNRKQIEGRFLEYLKVEKEIADLIKDLEGQKKKKATVYLRKVEERDKLKIKFSKLKKTKTTIRSGFSSGKGFLPPIKEFSQVSYRDKGITYYFRGRKPVFGTKEGRVTYSGRLGAYGNVVMIDHGHNTRSVIFGQFIVKVKKGDSIQKGRVVGYTKSVNGGKGQIHFEVRKKSVVQKTINYIDRSIIARNGHSSKRI